MADTTDLADVAAGADRAGAGGICVRSGPATDPLADPVFMRELTGRYLIWDAFVAGKARVGLSPLVLSAALHRFAVATAEGIVRLLGEKIASRAFSDEEERARYGFSSDTNRLAAASHRAGDEAALVRVDLLLDEHRVWRACEVNADCPGGQNEAFGLPRLARLAGAAGFRDLHNPTTVLHDLTARLSRLAAAVAAKSKRTRGRVALTYATAYAEDLQVCALIQRALARHGTETVLCPPTAPRFAAASDDETALHVAGRPIDVLYRFCPTEWFDGQKNVPALASAIESGRLKTLSSFAQMYTQSKLVMARAWALRESLSTDDANFLARHLPESFDLADLRPGLFIGERAGWVIKRALGRVGDEVFVGALISDEDWRGVVNEIYARRAAGERWIAQRFVPQHPIPTPWGPRLVTLGAYVLDGKFAGYFARLTTESHVSHDALVLPVFVERDLALPSAAAGLLGQLTPLAPLTPLAAGAVDEGASQAIASGAP